MKKIILIAVTIATVTNGRAQEAASAPAASPDVENLRQQVQALTETVKTLQQQVKDQQTTIDRLNQPNGAAPENRETPAEASESNEGRDGAGPSNPPSPSPAASAASTHFATEDTSVVSSTTNAPTASASP